MCTHYLHHIYPPTPFSHPSHWRLTIPTPPLPQPFRKNLFCPPFLWFCRRKNIKDDKRNMAFLLVWVKQLHREIPCVVSMRICITTLIGSYLPVLFTTS
jgi:hypothetical protein